MAPSCNVRNTKGMHACSPTDDVDEGRAQGVCAYRIKRGRVSWSRWCVDDDSNGGLVGLRWGVLYATTVRCDSSTPRRL